jgi:hypothetical protein
MSVATRYCLLAAGFGDSALVVAYGRTTEETAGQGIEARLLPMFSFLK